MTGIVEHPKRTGAASPEASANLLKAETILTPEELAARLKVPDSWVYEKTRTLPESDSMPASRALCAIQLHRRCDMADRPRAPGNPSGQTSASESPEGGSSGLLKTDLKQMALSHPAAA